MFAAKHCNGFNEGVPADFVTGMAVSVGVAQASSLRQFVA